MRALLRALGDPQLAVRGALVAGTNGKGSTLALVAAALREAGLRAGETPKPHLVTYRERMQIGGVPVSPSTFAGLVSRALAAADRVPRRLGPPTEFELLTAMVFTWFAEERVDLAVVEVGLGGRLDATHAWDGGVAAITNVDLDHMDRLGPTIKHIAREKAAIIERGDLAVTGATGDALAIVRRRAARLGVPLRIVEPAPIVGLSRDGIEVELPRLGRTAIGLRGRHQAANAAVADARPGRARGGRDRVRAGGRATGRLRERPLARPPGAAVDRRRRRAARRGPQPGRRRGARDRARRPAAVPRTGPRQRRDRVDGGQGRRRRRGRARRAPRPSAAHGSSRPQLDVPRALPADELARRWAGVSEPGWEVAAEPDPATALDAALATADGPVVVAGSLYLVGFARARLVDDPLLRDPAPAAPR